MAENTANVVVPARGSGGIQGLGFRDTEKCNGDQDTVEMNWEL